MGGQKSRSGDHGIVAERQDNSNWGLGWRSEIVGRRHRQGHQTLTGRTRLVRPMCWSPDGGRLVIGSGDGTFRVWDVKSGLGETILGPIRAGDKHIWAVCYSPDGKRIATAVYGLKIWDANSGELLKALEGFFSCLAWTSNEKTLIAGGTRITKFDTATWSQIAVIETPTRLCTISLSPNERILAGIPLALSNTAYLWNLSKTAYLWNLETDQLIKTLYHAEDSEYRAQPIFSADGKFLITSCEDYLYRWDLSAIVKEAGLPLEILDAPPQPAVKKKGASHIPPGFFDDDIRKANERIRLSQSHGPYRHPTPAPRQRALSRFSSLWRDSNSHRETDHHGRPQSHPLSWTRNLGILRRRDASGIELQEVEVPYTAGKPRNYHARKKKPVASSSRASNTHTTQPSSSSQPPPSTAAASTLSAVTGTAGASGSPHATDIGWCARFVGCICCASVQNADGHH
ncbi:quinon protein alcohol dehydrogenase-like superfamily [Suillus bovinus]|uniref:quinon protein alcohol dehydrogenase-like superfamily n=1 Tax=Suillus bovinus TaxID=48563 RepID=UPI001B87FCE3|nr:quinon protein alcohol dehydrogenase-like superfamily [Suillus bovinus]KAG2135405.1 quinon protein alcohol dehydrogenase-like superfamily [Suillus bovinus]